jgi:hypothetical protein
MEISKKKNLIEKHFPGEVEMLTETIVDELINGKEVEVIKISGSSQIDLVTVVSIIKLALDCIKFIYDTFIKNSDHVAKNAEISALISKKYPQISNTLGKEGVIAFIDDIRTK